MKNFGKIDKINKFRTKIVTCSKALAVKAQVTTVLKRAFLHVLFSTCSATVDTADYLAPPFLKHFHVLLMWNLFAGNIWQRQMRSLTNFIALSYYFSSEKEYFFSRVSGFDEIYAQAKTDSLKKKITCWPLVISDFTNTLALQILQS